VIRLAATLLATASFVATITPAQAVTSRTVTCGGFPLKFDTTIASAGPSRTRQYARSVVGLAAVIPADESDYVPRAWMVWDETGMAWLGLRQTSPAPLRKLWLFPTQPQFYGPGVQVRFTPMKGSLPRGYKLASCPDVSGAVKP
jgi:hypothetical protein